MAEFEEVGHPKTSRVPAGADESTNITVGAVDDPAERRADDIGALINRALAGPDPVAGIAGERVRRSAAPPATTSNGGAGHRAVRRSVAESAGVSGSGTEGGPVDRGTEREIGRVRQNGTPLPDRLREPAERATGADLGKVRLHTGSGADRVSRSLNATAFTLGNDIFMSESAGDPAGSGRGTLAHELGHVVDGSGQVRRLWGFGNKGRTKQDEDAEVELHERGPAEVASALKDLLTKKSSKSNYKTFNQVMQLLLRTNVGDVERAYTESVGSGLDLAIANKFDGFRETYLLDLLHGHSGSPSPINRVRLALGSGGYGNRTVISDQKEALRLINGLGESDLIELWNRHYVEIWEGMSYRAMLQVKAKVRAAQQLPVQDEPGEDAPGRPMPLTPPQKAALLDAWDAELGKMLTRAMIGETKSKFAGLVAVKTSFNLDQFAGELKGWLSRAMATEQRFFGGEPLIRHYVLGQPVPVGDGPERSGHHFTDRMNRRNFKAGWNEGDRTMIRMMISAGTVTEPQPVQGPLRAKVNVENSGAVDVDDATLRAVQIAVMRTTNTRVSSALSGLVAQMIIKHKRGTKSRSKRTIDLLNQLGPEDRDDLLSALLGRPKDDAVPLELAERRQGSDIFMAAMLAAKIKLKERMRIAGRLASAQYSDAYVAMRRYAGKESFKPRKFNQLVAALSPDDIRQARQDDFLVRRLRSWGVMRGLDADANPITTERETTGYGVAPGTWPDAPYWAERWAMFIGNVKDRKRLVTKNKSEKKIYSFALDIYAAGGSKGLADAYLWLVRDHPTAADRLHGFGLGKALRDGVTVGTKGDPEAAEARYDLVGKIIEKSKTWRPKGKADTDSIVGTFEALSAAQLLDEWTNIHEHSAMLARRKWYLETINELKLEVENAGLDDQLVNGKLERIEALIEGVGDLDEEIRSTFDLRLRDDRREAFNTGASQLTTGEYFTVMGKFTEHLAGQLRSKDMREALMERGVMPTDLVVTGERLLFRADRAQEANVATWHQWALFTNRGQLREESVGLHGRAMQDLTGKVAEGASSDEIAGARTRFGSARDELKARTKSFKDTANKYTERLKKLIGLLIDIAIMAGTFGAGAIPALAKTIISVATSFAKDMVLAVVDKVLRPSESNLLSEAGISLAKNTVKGAASFGLDKVTYALDVHLGLVDDAHSGLSGGIYVDQNGAAVISNALNWGSKEEWAASIASGTVDNLMRKLSNKLIDTTIKASTTDGADAWKAMFTDLGLADLVDIGLSGVMNRVLLEARNKMNVQLNEKDKDASGTITVTDLGQKWQGGVWDKFRTSNDDGYAKNSALPNLGAKFAAGLGKKAEDMTVFAFIDTVMSMPVAELEEKIARDRDADDTSEHRSLDSSVDEDLPEGGWDDLVPLTMKLRNDIELTVSEREDLAELMRLLEELVAELAVEDLEGDAPVEEAAASRPPQRPPPRPPRVNLPRQRRARSLPPAPRVAVLAGDDG